MANVSMISFSDLQGLLDSIEGDLKYLDVSLNNLNSFDYNTNVNNISHLYISDNKLSFLFRDQVLIDAFYYYQTLVFTNMSKSMSQQLSAKIFEFNNKLEYAHLSGNHLLTFPTNLRNSC